MKTKVLRLLYKIWDLLKGNPKLKPEMEVISYISDSTKTALDIGSLHGTFIRPMLRYNLNVIAFEPIKLKFDHIKNTHRKNAKVTIHNFGISDKEGEIIIRTPYDKSGKIRYGWSTIETENINDTTKYKEDIIKITTLDKLELENIGLVKIDVEGHEVSVLNGGLSLFQNQMPNVIIEAENRHKPKAPNEVIAFFKNLNYTGYFILGRKIFPIDEFDISVHQDTSKIDFKENLYNQEYAFNFIFISQKYNSVKLPAQL